MWAALFTAILQWLTALAKNWTQTSGADAQTKPRLRESLDRRLAEWKAKREGEDNGK